MVKEYLRKFKNVFSEWLLPDDENYVALRCPKWENCKLTNVPTHNMQFYHPCKYGSKCNSLNNRNGEWSHKFKFHHPCKYGDKCHDNSDEHRYCFIHGSDEPQWKECHGAVEKKKKNTTHVVQKPSNYQTTYQSYYGNSSNHSNNASSSYHTPNQRQPNVNYPTYQPQNQPQQMSLPQPHIHYQPQPINQSNNPPQPINPPTLLVCSYNILAQSYVSWERYSNITNKKLLEWEERKFKIYSTLKEEKFDIIGLQEVDNHHNSQIQYFLDQEGYLIHHSYKNYPKKDGLIIALNGNKFDIYSKGEKTLLKGYPEVFQYVIARDKFKNQTFCIINCHLTFQPGDTLPREEQVKEILRQIRNLVNESALIIWFGDFNTRPNEKPIQLIENCENLKKSHEYSEEFWTFCGTTGRNSVVDYIFHSTGLKVERTGPPKDFLPTESIPNDFHGSDHIPLFTEFSY